MKIDKFIRAVIPLWTKIQFTYLSWSKRNSTAYASCFGRVSFKGIRILKAIGINEIIERERLLNVMSKKDIANQTVVYNLNRVTVPNFLRIFFNIYQHIIACNSFHFLHDRVKFLILVQMIITSNQFWYT